MTLEEIEQYAEIGYKSGQVIPARHSCNNCVLGAAVYGKTGKHFYRNPGSFSTILDISDDVSVAIQNGFDGDFCRVSAIDSSQAYAFGERMAAKYLRAMPA